MWNREGGAASLAGSQRHAFIRYLCWHVLLRAAVLYINSHPTLYATLHPRLRVRVDAVFRDDKETQSARCGENLRLRLGGADEADISAGFVLSSIKNSVPMVTQFEAQLVGWVCIWHYMHSIDDQQLRVRCWLWCVSGAQAIKIRIVIVRCLRICGSCVRNAA